MLARVADNALPVFADTSHGAIFIMPRPWDGAIALQTIGWRGETPRKLTAIEPELARFAGGQVTRARVAAIKAFIEAEV